MKKAKQIGYLSAILISIGSSIGAGIFFKNGTIFANSGGSLAFLIASWIVAAFGIMAIGLALVELSSASKTDGGILEWVKKFTPKWFHKYSSSYMLLIYLPLNYFALPIYAVMSMQDSIQSVNPDSVLHGWSVIGIAFALFIWFTSMTLIKGKVSENIQVVFTLLKYAPLLVAPILSLMQVGDHGVVTHVADKAASGITGFSPWLGILGSIPAILFAVDGFYTVTSLKSELKDEKKLGSIVAVSIAILMGTYLVFASLMAMSGSGSQFDLEQISKHSWLGATFNAIVMMAVIGIVNGFAMATPKMYLDTFKEYKTGVITTISKWFKVKNDLLAAWIVTILMGTLFYLVLAPIGIYGFNTSPDYDFYGATASSIYKLADLTTNFTSMIVFLFIGAAILGGILNRFKNKVEVEKNKYFMPSAIIATVFIAIGGIYMFTSGFVDMFGVNGADSKNAIISFSIMAGTTAFAALPLAFKEKQTI